MSYSVEGVSACGRFFVLNKECSFMCITFAKYVFGREKKVAIIFVINILCQQCHVKICILTSGYKSNYRFSAGKK